MHRRIVYKVTAAFVMSLVLLSGCSGVRTGQGEELKELTDTESEEVREDKSIAGETKEEDLEEPLRDEMQCTDDSKEVYVHVCGQVASPGVYLLPAGSRLYEAIEAAGGLSENAAGELLNQAAQIEDGQQIYVPSREEAAQLQAGQSVSNMGEAGRNVSAPGVSGQDGAGNGMASDDGKIDLNRATREQLMTLSGIGEAKADSIIAYREVHGGFRKIEELMEVDGIKEGVFNKVKDQIKVS